MRPLPAGFAIQHSSRATACDAKAHTASVTAKRAWQADVTMSPLPNAAMHATLAAADDAPQLDHGTSALRSTERVARPVANSVAPR